MVSHQPAGIHKEQIWNLFLLAFGIFYSESQVMATQMANKATNRCQQFKVTEIKIKNGNNTQTKVIQIQQGQAGSRVCAWREFFQGSCFSERQQEDWSCSYSSSICFHWRCAEHCCAVGDYDITFLPWVMGFPSRLTFRIVRYYLDCFVEDA